MFYVIQQRWQKIYFYGKCLDLVQGHDLMKRLCLGKRIEISWAKFHLFSRKIWKLKFHFLGFLLLMSFNADFLETFIISDSFGRRKALERRDFDFNNYSFLKKKNFHKFETFWSKIQIRKSFNKCVLFKKSQKPHLSAWLWIK